MKYLTGSQLLPPLTAVALILLNLAVSQAAPAGYTGTSPQASLLSHWRRLFPSTTKIPDLLLSKSSHLTATQIDTVSSYIDGNILNTAAHLSAFCSAANVWCSDDTRHGDIQPDRREKYKIYKMEGIPDYDPASLEPGLFFREANITSEKKLHVPDIRDRMPKTSFLPKRLSDKLPLSSKSLQDLVSLLAVKPKMQKAMSSTMSDCELPPNDWERKLCIQSIEDMADFTAVTVGPKVVLLETQSADGWGQVATLGNVKGRNGGKVTPTVVCHKKMFPYLVYYCHFLSDVKVYEVELLIGKGAVEVKNHAVAVCHMDTSKWSAGHASFLMLGLGPGKTEVCHLIYESNLVWVAQE